MSQRNKKVKEKKGLIFNIQRFSIHDGPGIRTTVFMKGCPLACKWCSNPESQKTHPEIMTVDRKCILCGRCADVCPRGAITINESLRTLDRTKCDLCMKCVENCPSQALEIAGRYFTVEEVVAEVERDRIFYQNSEGGVTVSGGEPLLQREFVHSLLKESKARGFHTTLDTCGYAPWKVMEKVLEHVDLVLYDIKHVDSARHKADTGVSNELILSNAEKTSHKVRTWLRYPVIPGCNDSPITVREIANFASSIPIEKVSLLPYHRLGEQKYERLGIKYPLEGTPTLSKERMEDIAMVFKSLGLETTLGY